MPDGRNALHAYLTEQSHGAWHQMAADNGVSLTGLLHAVGMEMDELKGTAEDYTELGETPEWKARIKHARRFDAARRRRA